jgi:hypothetical protein
MPLTYHPDIELMAGLPWTIGGTLYDANGNLLDVTNCAFVWALLDPDGNPVMHVSITKTDPSNGAIQISVASAYTALNPGRSTDALQVTEGASTGLFWIGQICVAANPMLLV